MKRTNPAFVYFWTPFGQTRMFPQTPVLAALTESLTNPACSKPCLLSQNKDKALVGVPA